MTPPDAVRVGPSVGRGRGVFATRDIARDEVVEVAPVLVVPAGEAGALDGTVLDAYVFAWGAGVAIAFGYGSLYNHSWSPNLEYRKRMDADVIEFVALRDIARDEELCTNYTASNPHRADLWGHLK